MRAQLIGVAVDYDDDDERRRTHPMLLPKVEAEGMMSRADVEVLRQAVGIDRGSPDPESTQRGSEDPAGRRSVLDGMKYGPGPRPVWADDGASRFPAISKVLREAAATPQEDGPAP